ncbi:MAG TPA: protein translocase subunit SecD [Candidatus Woesebacteria bacterium]|nr:protein translocase subunit SecD [Candidatus Woesebacteria bacterium]
MNMRQKAKKRLFWIFLAAAIAVVIAFPIKVERQFGFQILGTDTVKIDTSKINLQLFGKTITQEFEYKMGLDIRGGMQVVLEADMSAIAEGDRDSALESARAVILRRVDYYGITEPSVQTARFGESYRLIIELPGVEDPQEALNLVGQTAQLEFALIKQVPLPETTPEDTEDSESASQSAQAQDVSIEPIGLTGAELRRSTLVFDPNTGEPQVQLEFNSEGRQIFADTTSQNTGGILGIFLDGAVLMMPQISVPIMDGLAVITGQFTVEEAKQLSIQLNAGALPIPIKVLEQRNIGASLGQAAVDQSLKAGLIGLAAVGVFMILLYGKKGIVANVALMIYAVFTLALYKIMGVTLSLPGIAGLILSIGMAVDANILIFERMKEELRKGKPAVLAMELGFGRAWDSIKDANLATIFTALILINPLNFTFLNSSGMVRGFGMTLLIGVLLGLFTGVVVTRSLVRVFLSNDEDGKKSKRAKL